MLPQSNRCTNKNWLLSEHSVINNWEGQSQRLGESTSLGCLRNDPKFIIFFHSKPILSSSLLIAPHYPNSKWVTIALILTKCSKSQSNQPNYIAWHWITRKLVKHNYTSLHSDLITYHEISLHLSSNQDSMSSIFLTPTWKHDKVPFQWTKCDHQIISASKNHSIDQHNIDYIHTLVRRVQAG